MKESIIFSGMLEVVAYMIIVVEPRAAIPREYNQILLPQHTIERSYQPYDRYSNTKLFRPEERLSYTSKGKIIYYKCINRTPSSANALMHVIRGGMGIPGLGANVRNTPARLMLVNRMIFTCDIYMRENDIVTNEETSPFETIYFKETTSPVNMETTIQRTEVDLTTQKMMESENSSKQSSKIGAMTRTSTAGYDSEAKSGKTNRTTARIKGMTVKPDRKIQSIQGIKKTPYTNRPGLKTSSEDSENGKMDRISLNAERNSTRSQKTTSKPTNSKTVQTTSQKRVTPPMMDKITSNMGNEDSGAEETIQITCQGTSLVTDEIDSYLSGIPNNEKASRMSFRIDRISTQTENTTLKVTSPKTVESTSQKSRTRLKIEKASSSTEVQGATTETAFEILCDEISLGTGKPNGQDTQEEENKSSNTKETIESQKEFPTYKLVLKIMPLGEKKKIGLAKITYS